MARLENYFDNFNISENLQYAEVLDYNLNSSNPYIMIESDSIISITESLSLKKHIKKEKQKNIDIKIKYKGESLRDIENLEPSSISGDWENIKEYISMDIPFGKEMLMDSKAVIKDNEFKIYSKLNLNTFFSGIKLDKITENTLKNLLGKEYTVSFSSFEDIENENNNKNFIEEKIKITLEQKDSNNSENANSNSSGVGYIKDKDIVKIKVKSSNNITVNDKSKKEIEKDSEDLELGKNGLIAGRSFRNNLNISKSKISELNENSGNIYIEGEILSVESRYIEKNMSTLFIFSVYDGTTAITAKIFVNKDKTPIAKKYIAKGLGVKIYGRCAYDNFSRDISISVDTIYVGEKLKKKVIVDDAEEKRIELKVHTKLSMLEGMIEPKDAIKRAKDFGMSAIGITEDACVQSFPEINNLTKDDENFKALYGLDAFMVNDLDDPIMNYHGEKIRGTEYVLLDIETTGFSFRTEKIIEFGAMKVKDGKILDTFECFVNPEKPLPANIIEITNITDDMVKDAETIEKVLPKFIEFCGDSVLVAHNADFDIGFIKYFAKELGYELNNTYLDTLRLAKLVVPELKRYKLGLIAKHFNIKVDVAHRALDDVKTMEKVFNVMLERIEDKNIDSWENIIEKYGQDKEAYKSLFLHRATIFAKNYVGLKNLYKLVSDSHVNHFYIKARVLKSFLIKKREGLLLGSGGIDGEVYDAIISGKTDEEILNIMSFYDFIEVIPFANAYKLYKTGRISSRGQWNEINKKIIELGKSLDKIVCATGDVYLLDKEDKIYREIIQTGKKVRDADIQPEVYFRTTNEMLKEFEFLGEELAKEVVIYGTHKVVDLIEKIEPISKVKCAPYIDGSEKELEDLTYGRAYELYGKELPDIIRKRIDVELQSIISNGFAVLYILAQKLVKKSNEDGYLVGSRGSVGSSLVAFFAGISEVNSLAPHYLCENCKYSEFHEDFPNGVDLPLKKCPNCGAEMKRDGMKIPFETFLGFSGDKEPDIDLNFSSEYQAKAHAYTLEIVGGGKTYKAGTIGTIAEKTAFGYAKAYFEKKGLMPTNAEVARIAKGCENVKATTGQHPGGIIVLPAGHEIEEFTPIQKPADKVDIDIITTHFDYHAIEHNLLKLDILGHDNPTILRMLQDITGIDPEKIELNEEKTMSLFSSDKALNIDEEKFPLEYVKKNQQGEEIKEDVGTNGIPEFGTDFVKGMLRKTRPSTFDELIRISGLSHGTDVWTGNAEKLVDDGICTLKDAICTRDDIMVYLISKGMDNALSFKTMESVRKGKGLKPEMEEAMRKACVPDWYITSCKKIKYMFPKAHAAAYVTAAFRIAWFKVYKPEAYYSVFLSVKGGDFNAETMGKGYGNCISNYKQLLEKPKLTDKEKNSLTIYEIVIEMYRRGITFAPIDLYESHYKNFVALEDGRIRMPFSSISGLGEIASKTLYNSAQNKKKNNTKFNNKEEIKLKAGIGDSVIELLTNVGALEGIPDSAQVSFFDLM